MKSCFWLWHFVEQVIRVEQVIHIEEVGVCFTAAKRGGKAAASSKAAAAENGADKLSNRVEALQIIDFFF